ncbi:MAG: hypothetical protein IKC95_05220 [Oscillospiraceae bacterium]|nr:hypothetical protein [Oscillospiraceae bacterium]
MYNRYVPQSDGSYQKNKMPEPQSANNPSHTKQKTDTQPPAAYNDCPVPEHPQLNKPSFSQGKPGGITNFFKQLLPKDIDTADLLIILLLLLMAGDSEENRNNALLTMALYFFM